MIPFLLTASVDTRGMQGAMFASSEREQMYVDTLNYYIHEFERTKTSGKLVFAENSGWPKESILSKLHTSNFTHIEYIALGSKGFMQEKGKSYNELLMMDRAIEQSKFIKEARCFFKLTGRFPILNALDLVSEAEIWGMKHGGIHFYGDCKDHNIFDWLGVDINGHVGESRYYAVSTDFWDKHFRGRYIEMNDYEGHIVENLILSVIRKTKHESGVHCRYRKQARFTGSGGHSLGRGSSFFHSTNNDSLAVRTKLFVRQFIRWTLPWFWL
jgi:hypothetical protein